jgi:hypothetical protein
METESALEWSEGGVELHTEATVYLDLTAIVGPRNTKYDLPFQLAYPLNECVLEIVGMHIILDG